MYFFCNHYIRPRPYCYVETEQEGGAHAGGEEDVEEGECHGGEHYGDHSHTLAHADGKELVVDVVLVGEEGVAAVAHTVEIYPHHIKARHEQRGERQDEGVDMVGRTADGKTRYADAQETEHDADGEAAGVAHEYLAPFLRLAEHIIIIERHEHPKGGEGKHGIDIQMIPDEGNAIEQEGYAAQAGGKAVDAVDEVDGVDDEHRDEDRDGHGYPHGHGVDEQHAVDIGENHAAARQHDAADNLYEELGAVAHAYQVVGYAHEIEHEDGAEGVSQGQCLRADGTEQLVVTEGGVRRQQQGEREEHHGLERHAAETGHNAVVDLALVGFVEQTATEGDEQYLRYHDAREEHAQGEHQHDVYYPNHIP